MPTVSEAPRGKLAAKRGGSSFLDQFTAIGLREELAG
jgi:hypothetical protein